MKKLIALLEYALTYGIYSTYFCIDKNGRGVLRSRDWKCPEGTRPVEVRISIWPELVQVRVGNEELNLPAKVMSTGVHVQDLKLYRKLVTTFIKTRKGRADPVEASLVSDLVRHCDENSICLPVLDNGEVKILNIDREVGKHFAKTFIETCLRAAGFLRKRKCCIDLLLILEELNPVRIVNYYLKPLRDSGTLVRLKPALYIIKRDKDKVRQVVQDLRHRLGRKVYIVKMCTDSEQELSEILRLAEERALRKREAT